jgi:hypothetical protein
MVKSGYLIVRLISHFSAMLFAMLEFLLLVFAQQQGDDHERTMKHRKVQREIRIESEPRGCCCAGNFTRAL